MNSKLFFSLAIGACLVAGDSYAQDRGNDRGQDRGGFGGPGGGDRGQPRGGSGGPGGDRGGQQGRGGFGGPGGGDRRGGPGGRPNFMSFLPILVALDADKNGEISSAEMQNAAAALKTLDKNSDGKLTEDEIRPDRPPGGRSRGGFGGPGGGQEGRGSFGGPPGGDRGGRQSRGGNRPSATDMAERMMAFDRNKDGKLTKDELSERMHPTITEADTDGDGAASKAELIKLAEKRAGQSGPGGRPQGGRGDQGGGGTRTPQRPQFDN